AVALSVIVLPTLATSLALPPVCGLVLHVAPVQTPRLKPTICDAFGDRFVIVTVTEPSVEIVKMCVNAPFCDNVPVNVSVDGFGVGWLAAASCDSVLSEHADVVSAASATIARSVMKRASNRDMFCIP